MAYNRRRGYHTSYFFTKGAMMRQLERDFQKFFLQAVKDILPGCMIIKVAEGMIQGIPDRIVLYGDKWFALEFKRDGRSPIQPNQNYYIDKLNDWSYAVFVYPDNAQEILDEIQQTFGTRRAPRFSQRI